MLKHVCNICGKDFDELDEAQNISICKRIGYGSMYDGSDIRIDFCNKCFDNLLKDYIIPKSEVRIFD